jgi:hypothetical protein
MSYNPEQLYEDEAKREHVFVEKYEAKYADIWDLAQSMEGADLLRDYGIDEFIDNAIMNIAITREAVKKAPAENRQAIKALCFEAIHKELNAVIERAAEYYTEMEAV